jgi:hypothetical protein
MRTISVRLDSKTDAKLRSVCERTGMSQSEALKAGIAALAAPAAKSPYELAKEMGLIGAFEGPPDLARNHSRYIKEKLRRQHRDRT